MDYDSPTQLARFAAYYGFRQDLLAGADPYRIEHAPADFTGRIAAIRITENGRFGNIVYQILHAVILARQLGAGTIRVFPFAGCPDAPSVQVEELRIVFRPEEAEAPALPVPTLVGHFFNSFAFESALQALPPDFVWDTVQRYLKPLFQDALGGLPPIGRQTLVMSFRAGDIFAGDVINPWYVQPPASFYTRALAFARAACDVRDVLLVFEDTGNPTIALVRDHLTAGGIPFAVQSGSFLEDLRCLAGAAHLVVPYSTFGEAAAMLSEHLKTYFAFRSFESHQHIHRRATPLLLGVLRQKGVRAVLIDDAAGDYIPARRWDRSPAQLDLMCSFPPDRLRIAEGEDADRREAAESGVGLSDQLRDSQSEASRIRHLLIGSRHEADATGDRLVWHEKELTRIGGMLRDSYDAADRLRVAADHARQQAEQQRQQVQQQSDQAQQRLLAETHRADHNQQVLEKIRRSPSWRVTTPLRIVARGARSILGLR